jgi:uncharacterized integral membrane protein
MMDILRRFALALQAITIIQVSLLKSAMKDAPAILSVIKSAKNGIILILLALLVVGSSGSIPH